MYFKLHYWPQFVAVWLVLTLATSYIIAVSSKSVYPILPHISELGFHKPASCVFSQLLNVGALLTSVLLYIRYKQIEFVIKLKVTSLHKVWNNVAFYLGVILSIGLSLVANFQGDPNGPFSILMVHLIGTFCALGIGGIYLIVQTKITFALQPYYDRYPSSAVSKTIQYFRLTLTVCYTISFIIICIVSNAWAQEEYKVYPKWFSPDVPGYMYHLITAIFEWILAIIFFSYTLTVTKELKNISLKGIALEVCVDRHNKKKN